MVKRNLFDYSAVPRRQRSYILAAMLFWSILLYLGISRALLYGVAIGGESMEPTLHDGDRLVAHRWIMHVRALKRGDVIAVKIPWHDSASVKRIVATPGEKICVRDGRVWINNEPLDEYYLPDRVTTSGGWMEGKTFEVLPGCYFVMGDNRNVSVDSRDFGAIQHEWIRGVVF